MLLKWVKIGINGQKWGIYLKRDQAILKIIVFIRLWQWRLKTVLKPSRYQNISKVKGKRFPLRDPRFQQVLTNYKWLLEIINVNFINLVIKPPRRMQTKKRQQIGVWYFVKLTKITASKYEGSLGRKFSYKTRKDNLWQNIPWFNSNHK